MKIKINMLDDEGSTIATIASNHDGKKDHGVVVGGSSGKGLACDLVHACRMALKSKLNRMPTSEEIVAELLASDPKRFEEAEAL